VIASHGCMRACSNPVHAANDEHASITSGRRVQRLH
jgi:hypothetical protein